MEEEDVNGLADDLDSDYSNEQYTLEEVSIPFSWNRDLSLE
jgi:hypothetical protein